MRKYLWLFVLVALAFPVCAGAAELYSGEDALAAAITAAEEVLEN